MNRNIGERILAASESNENQRSDIERVFGRLQLALKERKIGKAEFKAFSDAANQFTGPRPLILESVLKSVPGTSKRQKHLGLNVIFMGLTLDITPQMTSEAEINTSELSPYSLLYVVTPFQAARVQKQFPISFSDDHIHERLNQRAGADLDYSDPELLGSLQLSNAVIYGLADHLSAKGTKMAPIAVPHRDGLLLGHIELSAPQMFMANGQSASKLKGQFASSSGFIGDDAADWLPEARIYFKTFVGSNELFDTQKALYGGWEKLWDKHHQTITALTSSYIDYSGEVQIPSRDLEAFKADCLALYSSPEWQRGISAGMKHVPDESYDEVVFRQLMEMAQEAT